MPDAAYLAAGMMLAALGGEVFVRGAVSLAHGLRVPVGVVGVTVAAFATSAPEMAVAVNAALAGTPEMAAGDALGSNIVNIGLILGAVLVVAPLRLSGGDARRDLPLAIIAPLLLGLLAVDGRLSRVDGTVLVVVFGAWVATTLHEAVRERNAVGATSDRDGLRAAWVLTTCGIVLLLVAGRLVVVATRGIGETLGLAPFVVGATLVALGTSMPELSTAVISGLRRHGSLGASTILGSNIFNTLWIVGVTALVRPFSLRPGEIAVAVIAGAALAASLIPWGSLALGRRRGAMLLGAYVLYLGWLGVQVS